MHFNNSHFTDECITNLAGFLHPNDSSSNSTSPSCIAQNTTGTNKVITSSSGSEKDSSDAMKTSVSSSVILERPPTFDPPRPPSTAPPPQNSQIPSTCNSVIHPLPSIPIISNHVNSQTSSLISSEPNTQYNIKISKPLGPQAGTLAPGGSLPPIEISVAPLVVGENDCLDGDNEDHHNEDDDDDCSQCSCSCSEAESSVYAETEFADEVRASIQEPGDVSINNDTSQLK